jgi:hypothetical protein
MYHETRTQDEMAAIREVTSLKKNILRLCSDICEGSQNVRNHLLMMSKIGAILGVAPILVSEEPQADAPYWTSARDRCSAAARIAMNHVDEEDITLWSDLADELRFLVKQIVI